MPQLIKQVLTPKIKTESILHHIFSIMIFLDKYCELFGVIWVPSP